ncbi:MAG TPA: phenol 2-monooxygenase [Chloroflexia bacterium]|nr:phenol 2-monooxygenase [Chloroflexia bacterium]
MSYDLSPQVYEPRRQAFDYLTKRFGQREATRYEEGTIEVQQQENFHYRPLWNPAVEIFDPSMTQLKLEDWYSFLDPRQYYYGTYNQARNKSMEVLDAELNYAAERGLLERVAGEWREVFLSCLLPMRHYEYGGTTSLSYVSRFAYGTSIEQCASFNTFDKMANSQVITKLTLMLPNPEQWMAEGKQRWLDAEHLQPLRAIIEKSWLITDWAETILLQNLLLDTTLYGLLYDEFDRVAIDNGVMAVSFIHKYLSDWLKDNSRWTNHLIETFVNESQHGEANRAALQEMVDRWAPQVVEALKPLRKVFELPQRPGNFDAALERVVQSLERNLEKVGLALNLNATGMAVTAAD